MTKNRDKSPTPAVSCLQAFCHFSLFLWGTYCKRNTFLCSSETDINSQNCVNQRRVREQEGVYKL